MGGRAVETRGGREAPRVEQARRGEGGRGEEEEGGGGGGRRDRRWSPLVEVGEEERTGEEDEEGGAEGGRGGPGPG